MSQGADQVKAPLEGGIHALAVSTSATAGTNVGYDGGYVMFICDVDFYIKFGKDADIADPDSTATDADTDGAASDGSDRRAWFWPANTPMPLWISSFTRYFKAIAGESGTLRWYNG